MRLPGLVCWHEISSYEGDVSDLGWIVPLPAIPDAIQEGGAWTLQRLDIESHPLPPGLFFAHVQNSAASAQVIEQVQVAALNITVIKGSGQEILDWCAQNGFSVAGDTRAHLLIYAKASPIFMAAKYDTARAHAQGLTSGDGSPVLITMRVPHPWVPLEVLALDGQPVNADLYLLTDTPVNISDARAILGQSAVGAEIPGAPGFKVAFQEPMNAQLYHDLSTDRNMSWVWRQSWFTYLSLDAPDPDTVHYDMSISPNGVLRLAAFGTPPMAIVDRAEAHNPLAGVPLLPLGAPQVALPLLAGAALLLTLLVVMRARRGGSLTPSPSPLRRRGESW